MAAATSQRGHARAGGDRADPTALAQQLRIYFFRLLSLLASAYLCVIQREPPYVRQSSVACLRV